MKFLRKLLLPLLSILLVAGNQTLGNLYSYPLGVSSSVKHTTKADVNARDCAKQGKIVNDASSSAIKVEKVIAEEIKNLPVVRTNLSPHCLERCAERGLTKKMAEKAIEKGLRYYDPKNKSIRPVA